jgi:hypothetical protein
LTTFVDEHGDRKYLDFDTFEWKDFPSEWYNLIATDKNEDASQMDLEVAQDSDTLERCVHPLTGQEFECYMENGHRFYFHEESGDWVDIPLVLEIHVPSVAKSISEMEVEIPDWRNKKEMLMALRQHQYDAEAAIRWKRRELGFARHFGEIPSSEPGLGSKSTFTRANTLALVNSQLRPTSARKSAIHEDDDQVKSRPESAVKSRAQSALMVSGTNVESLVAQDIQSAEQIQAPVPLSSQEAAHLHAEPTSYNLPSASQDEESESNDIQPQSELVSEIVLARIQALENDKEQALANLKVEHDAERQQLLQQINEGKQSIERSEGRIEALERQAEVDSIAAAQHAVQLVKDFEERISALVCLSLAISRGRIHGVIQIVLVVSKYEVLQREFLDDTVNLQLEF